ncbi:MAG: radical SAM protein [Myxococcaceae bacterium]
MKLTLFLNHRCNLRCTYCYTGRKFDRRMSEDTVHQAVDFGIEHVTQGWLLLAFFGGEPLLEMEPMEEALTYATKRCAPRGVRLFATVATNGTVLDEARLALLKRYRFQVQVSLDGGKAAQDATRRFANGRSSASRVEKNLARLVEEGLSPWVVSVVDPSNVEHLGDSFEHLMELGVRYIHFAPNYLGAWDPAARERFETALEDLGDRYIARARAGQDVRLDPLSGKIVSHLVPGAMEKVVCKFGVGDVAVAPSGRLYPCERLVNEDATPELCIGDLEHGLDLARRDLLVAQSRAEDPGCSGCELKPRCKRFCGCANFETTGDLGRVSPLLCWFEKCFIGEADRVGNTLFAEQNEVFLKRYYRAPAASKGPVA